MINYNESIINQFILTELLRYAFNILDIINNEKGNSENVITHIIACNNINCICESPFEIISVSAIWRYITRG